MWWLLAVGLAATATGIWWLLSRQTIAAIERELNLASQRVVTIVPIERVDERWAWLGQTDLNAQTQALQSLGFEWAGDFEFVGDLPDESAPQNPVAAPLASPTTDSRREPSAARVEPQMFARLFLHSQHGCCAELMTIRIGPPDPLVEALVLPFSANITSVWGQAQEQICFATTNRAPDFWLELVRLENALWARHAGKSLAQLLDLHLQRRAQLQVHIASPLVSIHSKEQWIERQLPLLAQTQKFFARLQAREVAQELKAFGRSPQAKPDFEWLGQLEGQPLR